MNTFLETHNLPRLSEKKMENMNRLIMSKEIEALVKKFVTQNTLGPDSFTN